MNRHEFLSAMAALFCGVLLPEPVREVIRVATLDEVTAYGYVRGPLVFGYALDPPILDVDSAAERGLITVVVQADALPWSEYRHSVSLV